MFTAGHGALPKSCLGVVGGPRAQAQRKGASGNISCTRSRWNCCTPPAAADRSSCGAAAKKLRKSSARAATSGQRAISSSESNSARVSNTCTRPTVRCAPNYAQASKGDAPPTSAHTSSTNSEHQRATPSGLAVPKGTSPLALLCSCCT